MLCLARVTPDCFIASIDAASASVWPAKRGNARKGQTRELTNFTTMPQRGPARRRRATLSGITQKPGCLPRWSRHVGRPLITRAQIRRMQKPVAAGFLFTKNGQDLLNLVFAALRQAAFASPASVSHFSVATL